MKRGCINDCRRTRGGYDRRTKGEAMFIAWCIFATVILVAIAMSLIARGGKILRDAEREHPHSYNKTPHA